MSAIEVASFLALFFAFVLLAIRADSKWWRAAFSIGGAIAATTLIYWAMS